MSILDSLRERVILGPAKKEIAKALMDQLSQNVGSTPNVFSVPTSFNAAATVNNKRQIAGGVDFDVLRQLSISHETVRAAINVRKRQITGLEWEIVDDDASDGESSDALLEKGRQALLALGDQNSGLRTLLDMGIEDLLVLDGLAWYKQRNNAGKLIKLIPIDAATIKLRTLDDGSRPSPPEIAYEQWIKGKLEAEMTTDELLYTSINPRTNTPYGLSPLESMVLTVDAALQAMLYNVGYLSDSNIPQGFLPMPENWTPDQIKQYNDFFDAMVSGPKQQNKVIMVPAGSQYQPSSKPSDFSFKDFFDYLDRRICMLFDVTPQELGISLQQYKENAEGQDKIQMRKGIKPLAQFMAQVFTGILKYELGFPTLRMQFVGIENRFDTAQLQTLVPIGVVGIDEAREDLRLPKTGMGPAIIANGTITPLATALTVSGTSTPMVQESPDDTEVPAATESVTMPKDSQKVDLSEEIKKASEEIIKAVDVEDIHDHLNEVKKQIAAISQPTTTVVQDAVQVEPKVEEVTLESELAKWQKKAIKRFKDKGEAKARFESDLISDELHEAIAKGLDLATDIDMVKDAFANPMDVKQAFTTNDMRKVDTNTFLAKLERSKKYSQFYQAILDALSKQIEPFTKEDTIASITSLTKADVTTVGDILDSLNIEGLEGFLKWAGALGAKNGLQKLSINTSFDTTSPEFTNFINDRANFLITSVDDTTKDWLVRTIAEGKDNQLTNSEIAKEISDQIDEINRRRAETIVNTEVANASMQGELLTYKQNDVSQKVWVLSEDIGDECGENADAGPIGVDETFPSGDDAPPAHPNCRCYLQAVVGDE